MLPFNPFSALTSKIFGGLAIGLALALAVQTARIDGFLFFDGLKNKIAKCEAHSASLQAAIEGANAKAREARAKSETIKKDIDREYIERSKVGAVATDRFISQRRIVRADQGSVSAAAETGNTGSVEVAPSVPLVAVSEADVKIASELQAYADTCFAWVKGLRGSGLAD